MGDIVLLDHQADFVEDDYTRHILLLAGYGAGKTHGFIAKAYDLASKNVGHTGILLEPTAPLLNDILIPDMLDFLNDHDLEHSFVKSPQPVLRLRFEGGETRVLLRSFENWQRLIGINAAFIGTDEMDTVKKEIAMIGYKKLQGRLRAGNVRQMFSATTPEGFAAAYELFEKMKIGRIIRAKTLDNPYLPQDFIDDLVKNYPPNLLSAYMDGRFVNLTSGTVYSYFDREKHHTTREATERDVLHIGQDFNVGGCVSTIHVIDTVDGIEVARRVDEIESNDSFSILRSIRERYQDNHIVFYPDASGKNGWTSANESDIELLKGTNVTIKVPAKNGRVVDRVNAVNGMLSHGRYQINTAKCPKGTEALEQQAYKNNEPEKFNGGGTIDDYNDSAGYFVARRYPIQRRSASSSDFMV